MGNFLSRRRRSSSNRSRLDLARRDSMGYSFRNASRISSIGSSFLAASSAAALCRRRTAQAKYSTSAPGISMAAIIAKACSTGWFMSSHSSPSYRSDSLLTIGSITVSHAMCSTPIVAAIHNVANPLKPTSISVCCSMSIYYNYASVVIVRQKVQKITYASKMYLVAGSEGINP